MSGRGEKTEWPSEQALRRLRGEGVVPLSALACACAGALGFLSSLWFLRPRLQSLFRHLGSFDTLPDTVPSELLADAAILLIVPPLVMAAAVVLVGLLQTRFLFRFDLAAFQGQRLFRLGRRGVVGRLGRVSIAVFVLGAAILCGWVALRISWTGMLYLLNNDRLYASAWLGAVGPLLLVPLCAVFGVVGVLAWFGRRWSFLYEHRMSRQELQEEQAETEVRL